MLVSIIILVIGLIVYKFYRDSEDEKKKTESVGGLDRMYPRFINYVESFTPSSENISKPILVKNTSNIIEYKINVYYDSTLYGAFHFHIYKKFATLLECYYVLPNNKIVKGYGKEISNSLPEPTEAWYSSTIQNFMNSMMSLEEIRTYLESRMISSSDIKKNEPLPEETQALFTEMQIPKTAWNSTWIECSSIKEHSIQWAKYLTDSHNSMVHDKLNLYMGEPEIERLAFIQIVGRYCDAANKVHKYDYTPVPLLVQSSENCAAMLMWVLYLDTPANFKDIKDLNTADNIFILITTFCYYATLESAPSLIKNDLSEFQEKASVYLKNRSKPVAKAEVNLNDLFRSIGS